MRFLNSHIKNLAFEEINIFETKEPSALQLNSPLGAYALLDSQANDLSELGKYQLKETLVNEVKADFFDQRSNDGFILKIRDYLINSVHYNFRVLFELFSIINVFILFKLEQFNRSWYEPEDILKEPFGTFIPIEFFEFGPRQLSK